jgi:hypothetical protein
MVSVFQNKPLFFLASIRFLVNTHKRKRGKMNKKAKKLIRGQAVCLIPDGTIVCFVKKFGQKMSVISWPGWGGGCPVRNEEFFPVDESELSAEELADLRSARDGMERHYPKNN